MTTSQEAPQQARSPAGIDAARTGPAGAPQSSHLTRAQPSAGHADAHRRARMALCLERARRGEMGALDPVVQELSPLLWHVARAQGLSIEDSADVVQTAWLELVRQLADVRSAEALVKWLVTTTRREAWRVNRRSHGHESDPQAVERMVDPRPGMAEILEAHEQYATLWRHFADLPKRCQQLLRIVAATDRPDYDIVAQAIDMPRGSIGPTRGRCLNKLREMLLADPTWSVR